MNRTDSGEIIMPQLQQRCVAVRRGMQALHPRTEAASLAEMRFLGSSKSICSMRSLA